MKHTKFFILFLIFLSVNVFGKTNNDDLNGKTFRGKATEITPPNIDRMPIVHNEFIKFENGKLYSDVFKIYSVDECNYSAAVDDRRAIALKVVTFNAGSSGKIDGQDVYIELSGSVVGERGLSGTITIHYPDNSEVKFLVEAKAE